MMRVNLPPGCMGFKASDGTRYVAKPGTHVDVDERHMPALRNQDYASAGLVDAGPEKFIVDSKKAAEGRWCVNCSPPKSYYKWTTVCPRCHQETIPDSELSLPKAEKYTP